MSFTKSKNVAELLHRDIPKDFVLAVLDALNISSERAYNETKELHKGHIKNARGQMRHFEQNEAFYTALVAHGLDVSELKGNQIVIGKAGIWNISRGTANDENWHNLKRSKSRQLLAQKNDLIERLVYQDLFDKNEQPEEGTVFFISSFSKNTESQAQKPIAIQIAVCDRNMNNWLYIEDIGKFIDGYADKQENVQTEQQDMAKPVLKSRKEMYGTSE